VVTTYTDGDKEELSQTELRDGYLLGLSKEIETQWNLLQKSQLDKQPDKTPARPRRTRQS
jgi:hypothetical protein